MAGEIGQLLEDTRGFLGDTLGRFRDIARKRAEEYRPPALADYIGQSMPNPMDRIRQLPFLSTPGGGSNWFGSSPATTGGQSLPTMDWIRGHGLNVRNPFAAQAEAEVAGAGTQAGANAAAALGGGGGGSNQAATSADNANLTGAQINAWIAQTRGNAPINGMGDYILQVANQYGVSAPLMLGIFLKESELGTTAGPNKVISGITGPGDGGLGGQRVFQGFATWQDAIAATAQNLATGIYKGKSINEQVGAWYVGPQEYAARGLGATDKAGNGTVGDYVNLVAGVYNALGVPFNPAEPARSVAPTGGGQGYQGSAAGVASLFGGTIPPMTQEFNAHNPGLAGVYDFGTEFGMDGDGHTGWDIGAPVGTQFYMPAGLSGTVSIAGCTAAGCYYTDEQKGAGEGRGELRITLDQRINGQPVELILGHNSQLSVRPGQRISAGDFLGLTGWANGAHQHVEVRVYDPSLPGQWRIIDPAMLFGGYQ